MNATPRSRPRTPNARHDDPPDRRRPRLGLPVLAVIGLALLAVPRVVLHDLDVIHEGTVVNALFVFVPPVVWIAAVLWRRVPNPVVTLLAVGVLYGIVLALGHQMLWHLSVGQDPPRLGGNLADIDPAVQTVILRAAAAVSSLVTGTVVGVVTGLIAWALRALTGPARR